MKLLNLFPTEFLYLRLPLGSLASCILLEVLINACWGPGLVDSVDHVTTWIVCGSSPGSKQRAFDLNWRQRTHRPSFGEVEAGLQVFQRLLHGLVLPVHEYQALVCAAINRLGV